MKHPVFVGILASLIFLAIFHWKLIPSFDKPLSIDGDMVFNYFVHDNNLTKLSTLKFSEIFDTRMFYPEKNTLAFSNGQLLHSVIALPVYLLTENVFASTHFIILVGFFSSFLAMYLFVFQLTKKITSSVLAALIFSYNPFVMAHFIHPEYNTLAFIPLLFLFTNRLLRNTSWFNAIAVGLIFFLQLISSFYYFTFLLFIWPLYLLLYTRIFQVPFKRIINHRLFTSLAFFSLLGFIFLQPYIEVKRFHQMKTDMDTNIFLSTQIPDFLFTSNRSMLYGWMVTDPFWKSIRHPYTATHFTEHSFFLGVTVYALIAVFLWFLITKRFEPLDKKVILVFLVIYGVCLLLSFGPYLSFFGLQIPFPYLLLYKFVPFVDSLRVPSRFMIIGFFALSVLLAFTWNSIEKRLKSSYLLLAFILLLICIEYSQNIESGVVLDQDVRQFYSWLSKREQTKVIVELPMGNIHIGYENYFRDIAADSKYLLYAIYHNKKMVNGYSSFMPEEVEELGSRLAVNFPTVRKLEMLKEKGVDTIIIHLDEYKNRKIGEIAVEKLQQAEVPLIYSSENIYAFALN